MVSPELDILSLFVKPWMRPTSNHCATKAASRAITLTRNARLGHRLRIMPREGVVGDAA
jgi:hypothetical protein